MPGGVRAMDDDDVVSFDPDGLVTGAQAAQLAKVTSAAIRLWVHRGHLTKAGIDEHGRSLYRVTDVARAEYKTRKRARRDITSAAA